MISILNKMILSKKFLLVILICSVVLGGLIAYIAVINSNQDSNQVINQDDLREYIRIYLDTYRSIIEPLSNLTEKEIELFKFYNNYPYSAIGEISESHRVWIQFIPKSSQPYQLKEINENIEDKLFPKMPKDAPDMLTAGLAIMGNQTSYASVKSAIKCRIKP